MCALIILHNLYSAKYKHIWCPICFGKLQSNWNIYIYINHWNIPTLFCFLFSRMRRCDVWPVSIPSAHQISIFTSINACLDGKISWFKLSPSFCVGDARQPRWKSIYFLLIRSQYIHSLPIQFWFRKNTLKERKRDPCIRCRSQFIE